PGGRPVRSCVRRPDADLPALHPRRTRLGRARLGRRGVAGDHARVPGRRGSRRDGRPDMKVALVHDWLTGMRGGERMLERLAALFPEAPICTLVWNRGSVSPAIESHPIRTSFLQRMPGVAGRYRWYLPLFPRAIERFELIGFDAVISSSH